MSGKTIMETILIRIPNAAIAWSPPVIPFTIGKSRVPYDVRLRAKIAFKRLLLICIMLGGRPRMKILRTYGRRSFM